MIHQQMPSSAMTFHDHVQHLAEELPGPRPPMSDSRTVGFSKVTVTRMLRPPLIWIEPATPLVRRWAAGGGYAPAVDDEGAAVVYAPGRGGSSGSGAGGFFGRGGSYDINGTTSITRAWRTRGGASRDNGAAHFIHPIDELAEGRYDVV